MGRGGGGKRDHLLSWEVYCQSKNLGGWALRILDKKSLWGWQELIICHNRTHTSPWKAISQNHSFFIPLTLLPVGYVARVSLERYLGRN